jgi:hypothetical protein
MAVLISLGLVAAAERDSQTRPPSGLRGSKRLWQLVCLNAIGALAYFRSTLKLLVPLDEAEVVPLA